MKHLVFSLTVFCLLASTVSCDKQQIKYVDLESIYRQNIQDSVLATGWYHIVDDENGFKRQLDKSEIFYFIDPNPILVKEHFDKIKIYKTNFRRWYQYDIGLSFQVYKDYYDLWADATEKSIGKKIGLIIDNKLVTAPTVQCKISEGRSSLQRPDYDEKDLETFKKLLK